MESIKVYRVPLSKILLNVSIDTELKSTVINHVGGSQYKFVSLLDVAPVLIFGDELGNIRKATDKTQFASPKIKFTSGQQGNHSYLDISDLADSLESMGFDKNFPFKGCQVEGFDGIVILDGVCRATIAMELYKNGITIDCFFVELLDFSATQFFPN